MFAREDTNGRTGSSAGPALRAQAWGCLAVGVGGDGGLGQVPHPVWGSFPPAGDGDENTGILGCGEGAKKSDSLIHSRPTGQAQAMY